MSTETIRLIRDEENVGVARGGGGGYADGVRGRLYTCRYTVTTRMTPQMGSNENHFNVSLIVRDKITRSTKTTIFFEEKGELKQNGAEALLLTSLTP